MRKIILNNLLITLGWFFVLLAIVGVVLPILPTTPFLIIALGLFSKSSPKFHRLLIENKWFGPSLKQWEDTGTVSRQTKRRSTTLIILTFATSIFILYERTELQLLLVSLALILLFFIWRLREPPAPLSINQSE